MIQTTRYKGFDLIVHRCSGETSAAEIRRTVEESHAGSVLPLEIWDFSDAAVTHLQVQDLGTLLGQIFPLVPQREDEKTAIVAPKTEDRELALLFQRMAEFQDFPVLLRPFPDLTSAVVWLFGPNWESVLTELSPHSDHLLSET